MRQPSNSLKVTYALLWAQMQWTIIFLGIMFAIHLFRIGRMLFFNGSPIDNYFMTVLIAANIYMFVIGIISIYFLRYSVENGVTRKDYFKGTLLASIGLSIVIPIISFVVSIVERFVFGFIISARFADTDMNTVDFNLDAVSTAGDIIGNIIIHVIQAFILTPYLDPDSHWILALSIFGLTIFTFYMLGWFISASFKRLGTLVGLGVILVAIVLLVLKDTLLRIALDLPVSDWFTVLGDLSPSIALLGILVILLVTMWFIRILTKRMPIEM